jgi:hypothetical protein
MTTTTIPTITPMTNEEQIEIEHDVPLPVSQLPDIIGSIQTTIEMLGEDPDADDWQRGYLSAMEDVMESLRRLPNYIRSKLH